MLVWQLRQDLLANDLANAQTPGYRPQDLPVTAFPQMFLYEEVAGQRLPRGVAGTGAYVGESYTRWRVAGPVRFTGRSLDVAIEGEGFFAVETPAGPRLTRAGNFHVDGTGWLVSAHGWRVLGVEGPIWVGDVPAERLSISEEGVLLGPGGEVLGQLLVADVADRAGLVREGANLYRFTEASGGPVRVEVAVRQGMLEGSGTSVVQAMVEMIAAVRAYQAAQVAIRSHDELTGELIQQVGRLS